MIRWSKKEIIVSIVLISLCIIIPIILHILFKLDFGIDFLYATWSCGDILQYSGSILAALLAIFGVYYTLKESRQYELSKKVLENKPYFRTTFVRLTDLQEYETLTENKNRICIWNKETVASFNLKNIQSKREFISFFEKNNLEKYVSICYDIENIGVGNAINFNLKIGDNKFFPKLIICSGESVRVYLLIEKRIFANYGQEFLFTLTYEDIIKVNVYEQSERFFITYDKETDDIIYQRDFRDELSEPLSIEKKIYE